MTFWGTLNFWGLSWLYYPNVVFWIFGISGWLLLVASGTLSSQTNQEGGRRKPAKVYWPLAIGSAIMSPWIYFILAQQSFMTPTFGGPSLLFTIFSLLGGFVIPLGLLCLTIGWALVASAYSKKLPIFYVAAVAS